MDELFRILEILKNNGVDITKIPIRYSVGDGKREYCRLSSIRQDGIDIQNIIKEYNLNGNFNIGQALRRLREKYVQKTLEKGWVEKAEDLKIVTIIPEGRKPPIFKGRKVSQFHVDIVREHLEDMISGNLNTKEIIKLINKRAEECGETLIRDNGTIKRIVVMILGKESEKYRKYEEVLKQYIGTSSPRALRMRYASGKDEFKDIVIQQYLPRILRGEVDLTTIILELQTSGETIYKIIREHYANDEKGLETFKNAVKKNIGNSPKRRKQAADLRAGVAEFEIVSSAEFILLSEEDQDRQIVMKIRKEKLKEELSKTSKAKTAIISEDAIRIQIERIKNYFRSKNNPKEGKIYFSEKDIRLMIFAFPTLISRKDKTLDKKFEVLVSFDYPNLTGIPDETLDENNKTLTPFDGRTYEIVYGMVKTFSGILGYTPERIEKQLSLLCSEKLLDYIISNPMVFRMSLETMYALINFAKERHKTADLSDVNRSNIFMSNSSLKRVYGVTYEDIKNRYPLPSQMVIQDGKKKYSVGTKELGKVGSSVSSTMREKASVVLGEMALDNYKDPIGEISKS